jgi:hypothetical protein
MTKNIIMDNWVDEFSKFIAEESFKLNKTVGRPKGLKTTKRLLTRFVKFYVEYLVMDSLVEYKERDLKGSRAYEFTRANLSSVKIAIQEEVARGFEDAFQKYSGQLVEYYVTINEVPEPKNKEVC